MRADVLLGRAFVTGYNILQIRMFLEIRYDGIGINRAVWFGRLD